MLAEIFPASRREFFRFRGARVASGSRFRPSVVGTFRRNVRVCASADASARRPYQTSAPKRELDAALSVPGLEGTPTKTGATVLRQGIQPHLAQEGIGWSKRHTAFDLWHLAAAWTLGAGAFLTFDERQKEICQTLSFRTG
jgi:hypothetical protein